MTSELSLHTALPGTSSAMTAAAPRSRSPFRSRTLCALALSLPLLAQAEALLPIEHWQQPSGAQIWLVHSPSLPMVDIQIDFDGGARRDPAEQAGLASAAAGLLTKGIRASNGQPALDDNQLGQAWADLGASLTANASSDRFSLHLRSLTEAPLLQQATALAARQIAHPAWDDSVWQRERQRWSAMLQEAQTRPATLANQAFEQAVYGSHPYGYQTTPQSLQRIDTRAIARFYAAHVQPCRAKASVVGQIDRAQADRLVAHLLASLPAAVGCTALPAVPEVQPLTSARTAHIPFASEQAHVLIGQPGIGRDDPDFLTMLVANHILGGSGFGSLLMQEVREKRGLVYGINSHFLPGSHAGAFSIGLQTRADQAEQATALVHQVLADFVANGPTEQQVRDAKANLIGGFALRLDSNAKLLGNVANIAWNGLPLDYLDHWTEQVNAITAHDIRRTVQRVLQPTHMATVIVGGPKP